MKKRFKIIAGVVVSAGLILGVSIPASAVDDRYGYRECGTSKLSIASHTSTAGSPTSTFAVAHTLGTRSTSWSTAGAHSWRTGLIGGNWSVSTTGTILTAGASCYA